MKTLLDPFRPAATAPPVDTRFSGPTRVSTLPRTRGKFDGGAMPTFYDAGTDDYWMKDSRGPFLSSALEGTPGFHAPMFDIDRSVSLSPSSTSAQPILWVPEVSERAAARMNRRLRSLGLGWCGYSSDARTAYLQLDVPVKLIPSSTPGHFHLYVESVMDMKASLRFARALDAIVDKKHIRRARTDRQWVVLIGRRS